MLSAFAAVIRRAWPTAVLVLAGAAAIAYFLRSGGHVGYRSIEVARYLIPADAGLRLVTPISEFAAYFTSEMRAGALGPLAAIPLAVWFFTPPAVVIFAAQTLLLTANVVTFFFVVRTAVRRIDVGLLATVLLLTLVQYRSVGDVFHENMLVLPLAVECVLLALFAALRSVDGDARLSRRRFVESTALLVAAVAVVPQIGVAGAAVALAWRDTPNLGLARVRAAVGWLIAIASVTLAVYPHLRDGVAFWKAVVVTALAPFPSSNRGWAGFLHDRFLADAHDVGFPPLPAATLIDWIVVAACAIIVVIVLGRRQAYSSATDGLTSLGATLWIAASLDAGEGAFLCAFGAALAATGIVCRIARRATTGSRLLRVALGAGVVFLLYGNVRTNRALVAQAALPWDAVVALQRAGAEGVFASLSRKAPVTLTSDTRMRQVLPVGEEPSLLHAVSGARFVARRSADAWLVRDVVVPNDQHVIEVVRLLGHAPRWTTRDAIIAGAFTSADDSRAFVDSMARDGGAHFTITFTRFDGTSFLAELARPCATSIDRLFAPAVPRFSWQDGFSVDAPAGSAPPLPDAHVVGPPSFARDRWRYAGKHAVLHVASDSCDGRSPEMLALSLFLVSPAPGTLTVGGTQTGPILLSTSRTGVMLPLIVRAPADVTFDFHPDTPSVDDEANAVAIVRATVSDSR